MTRPVSIRDGVMTKNSDPDLFSTGRQSSGKRAEASKPTTHFQKIWKIPSRSFRMEIFIDC